MNVSRPSFTRRRALRIFAGLAGMGALSAGVRLSAPDAQIFSWHGAVMDAPAEIALWSHSGSQARNIFRKIEIEIARYHRIFSLADAESEIVRLNRDGALAGASPDLLELIGESLRLGGLSDGCFDISVQPLWRLYEAHFWSKTEVASDICARAIETARTFVDYRRVHVTGRRIHFARSGMTITLNGIAQGFITDRIADLLRNEGFDTGFVDLGEMRALGSHPDGRPWRAALRDARTGGQSAYSIELENTALAVSGGYGTVFEPSGTFHHIFNPATGASASGLINVAVIAPRATIADGLSTAIYAAGESQAARLLGAYASSRAILTRANGETIEIVGATA